MCKVSFGLKYILVPHEQMIGVKSINGCLMSEIIETFSLNGCEKIPDHSVLIWETELLKYNNINLQKLELSSTHKIVGTDTS